MMDVERRDPPADNEAPELDDGAFDFGKFRHER
jgi:hypothetical protein